MSPAEASNKITLAAYESGWRVVAKSVATTGSVYMDLFSAAAGLCVGVRIADHPAWGRRGNQKHLLILCPSLKLEATP